MITITDRSEDGECLYTLETSPEVDRYRAQLGDITSDWHPRLSLARLQLAGRLGTLRTMVERYR